MLVDNHLYSNKPVSELTDEEVGVAYSEAIRAETVFIMSKLEQMLPFIGPTEEDKTKYIEDFIKRKVELYGKSKVN